MSEPVKEEPLDKLKICAGAAHVVFWAFITWHVCKAIEEVSSAFAYKIRTTEIHIKRNKCNDTFIEGESDGETKDYTH